MAGTVVLVHGAFHGAWCWERVVPLVETAGVRAVTLDLPGHGADPGPFTDLHGDAARVREALGAIDGPVVLCGHSYGGAVVTAAGAHPAVARLVYLAALVPDADETSGDCWFGTDAGEGPAETPIATAIEPCGEGVVCLPAEHVGPLLYNDCDEQTVAWAVAHVGPQPTSTFTQTPGVAPWRDVPATYVRCTEDRTIPPQVQAVLAARCAERVDWDTSHSPFASRPQLVADLLVRLASEI